MTTTLITGANKGLGFETARRLIALGHRVYLGARHRERGEDAARQLGALFVPLDVTDDASIAAAAVWIEQQKAGLDVLINNAGIAGERVAPADTTADHVRRVYETNVLGIVRVTHAMLPLLRASAAPVIVNVSSALGSFAAVTDPTRLESKYGLLGYCSSKAAVGMLTVQYAKALPELRINAVDPGYTATFLAFYKRTLDYVIDLNRRGTFFVEGFTQLLLTKILTPFSTGYVDLQSPAGAGISAALYNYDGDVYTNINLADLWIDPVDYQNELRAATLALAERGMRVSIYNHQLCTIPRDLWPFARQSISDWKNIFVPECEGCSVKGTCSGFFHSAAKRHSAHIAPIA